MEAIEIFLKGKKFLMGDQVCNEDASMFGILCQAVYHDRGPMHTYVMGRMKYFKHDFVYVIIGIFVFLKKNVRISPGI